ncbi:hypothetical protein JTB14_022404 [Gonioctena quinquepunctata]|nr:hypothetical protein JTB14_022404 [Gonioctena quinquepunctata]
MFALVEFLDDGIYHVTKASTIRHTNSNFVYASYKSSRYAGKLLCCSEPSGADVYIDADINLDFNYDSDDSVKDQLYNPEEDSEDDGPDDQLDDEIKQNILQTYLDQPLTDEINNNITDIDAQLESSTDIDTVEKEVSIEYSSVSPVGYVKRSSWSDEEKSHVSETFKQSIESQTLPSTESLAKYISDSPILKNRNPIQLKSWISNQIQKQRKAEPNCRRRKGTTENTETPVENTEPQQIQNIHMETQDETLNVINEVKKPPPPIFIREKKLWPEINETLKNLGIKSIKNYNTRDGIRMMLPNMETYDKCTLTLDQHKVQYHTFKSPQNREIRAIFKGIAEDIDQTMIEKELKDKGFNPRVVPRFKNRNGQNMPIILVIVPGSQDQIKNITQICDIEVRFEFQRKKGESGSVTTANDLDTVLITARPNRFVGTVQEATNQGLITKMMPAPTNVATARAHIKPITEDALTFPPKKRRTHHPLSSKQGRLEMQEMMEIFQKRPIILRSENYYQPWMN